MIADSENLLSDHGHHLLYCVCGTCSMERWAKRCSGWFNKAREMPDDEFRRVAALWRWMGTIIQQ